MSQDVVEAKLVRHHVPGQEEWKDTFTAIITHSVAGSHKIGDKINRLDLTEYDPAETGQYCILFLANRQFSVELQPSEVIPVQVADMLLVDKHSRIRRYFQDQNPGGLLAEGYSRFGLTGSIRRKHGAAVLQTQMTGPVEVDSAEETYPTLAKEYKVLAAKWAKVAGLRLLLSHSPRPADFPVLLKLLDERRAEYVHQRNKPFLQDVLSPSICQRFAGSQRGWDYARFVSQDRKQPIALRSAAAEVLRFNSRFSPLPTVVEQTTH